MLSPSTYSDESIFQKEMEVLFGRGPGYVGHTGMVPHIGDYSTLEDEGHGRMLVHGENGIELVSNICRHRQAIMLRGRGQTKSINCPLHKWSWKLSGEMLGAPHFPKDLCMHLRKWSLQNWRGLLFSGHRDIQGDLEGVEYETEINFDNYRYHHTERHSCHYNWKTFMEVYGDDYHVAPAHPGLSRMLDIQSLEVVTGDEWHIQTMRSTENHETRVTPIYRAWREKCLSEGDGKLPEYGAVWFAYYPNVMIEVYPYTITVSTLHPISPTETMNVVEFYYHNNVSEDLIEAEKSAYMETALEDDDIAERMEAGRAILRDHATEWGHTADELVGPAHQHLEKGTEHFIEWYRERMSL